MASSAENGNATESTKLLSKEEEEPIDSEERSRRRVVILLVSFSAILIVVALIAIWHANRSAAYEKAHKASRRAAHALKQLNTDISQQSKLISKGCESTLVLLRHCEKHGPSVRTSSDSSEHCSYIGQERAEYLATLFGGHPHGKYPTPSHLFALTPDRKSHKNFREWETLHPLSEKSGIMIEIAEHPTFAKDFFELLQAGVMCGRVAVVSWKHSFMAELASRLGCSKANGCPEKYREEEFDEFWQIKYVFHPDLELPKDERAAVNSTHPGRRLSASTSRKGWNVYGTVSKQGFDPLAFSYQSGDYPSTGAGAVTGGRWRGSHGSDL